MVTRGSRGLLLKVWPKSVRLIALHALMCNSTETSRHVSRSFPAHCSHVLLLGMFVRTFSQPLPRLRVWGESRICCACQGPRPVL